jgi:hypothetical protein
MSNIKTLVNQLESHIPNFEKTNSTVSNSNIGWHIDHSLMVINGIIDQVKKSNPEQYKWRFNWNRIFIQIINKIPRGKAKAPKVVQPYEPATIDVLISKLEIAKNSIDVLESLNANSYFTHPYFGDLNLKKTLWFLNLHTNHHLKIIKDIADNV